MKLKETKRELYIDRKYSTLYGFDWKNKEVIYRQALETENGVKPVYIRIPFEE